MSSVTYCEVGQTFLSAKPISFTADYLFRRAKALPEYVGMGREILRRMEERLVHTEGHAAAPAPGVAEIRSEFFYDPFVAGDLAEHANIFYEIIRGIPHLSCYLINTGGIGEGEYYRDIRLEHTMAVLDSLLRGGLEDWSDSPTGFRVPREIRYVDDIYLHPEKLYCRTEFEENQRELN